MIANVATLNEFVIHSYKGDLPRSFTIESLTQLSKTAVGKPVTLGFNGIKLGEVTESWVEDDRCLVKFSGTTFDRNYLVPGFKTTTTKNNKFTNIMCMDFALVDKPADKSLLKLSLFENVLRKEESGWYFLDELQVELYGPFATLNDVLVALDKYSEELNVGPN